MFLVEKAVEELVESGLVRTIAVTNLTITKLRWLMHDSQDKERTWGRVRERLIDMQRTSLCSPSYMCMLCEYMYL